MAVARPKPKVRTKAPEHVIASLREIQRHVDPEDDGFRGSRGVREHLEDRALRNYLQSWVYPELEKVIEWATAPKTPGKAR